MSIISKETLPYKITFDTNEHDGFKGSPEVEKLVASLPNAIESNQENVLELMEKGLEQEPDNPSLWNCLAYYYYRVGNNQKVNEITYNLAENFPKFVVGRTNLIQQLLTAGYTGEAERLLGSLDLATEFPERKIFTIQEFNAYIGITCIYFAQTNRLEDAAQRLSLMEAINKDQNEIARYKTIVTEAQNANLQVNQSPPPDYKTPAKENQTTYRPGFNHSEIKALYEYDTALPKATIEKILSLPRPSLIEDLETVLKDSVERYEHFQGQVEAQKIDFDEFAFALHAMNLLGQLKAKESLPVIFETLSYFGPYMELWFGDHTTETIPLLIAPLVAESLPECKAFMQSPNIWWMGKAAISSSVAVVGKQYPNLKATCVAWTLEILEYYITNRYNRQILDRIVVSMLATNLMGEFKAGETLDMIDKLFSYNLPHEQMLANKDHARQLLLDDASSNYTYLTNSMTELYEHIEATWFGAEEVDP